MKASNGGKDKFYGRHLAAPRLGGLYTHHGIGDGEGGVIQYSGKSTGLRKGPVERVTLSEFAQGPLESIRIVKHDDREFGREEIVERARECIGEDCYDLVFNNCEHFAEWCVTGTKKSRQVRDFLAAATSIVVAGTVLFAGGRDSGRGGVRRLF